MFKKTKYILKSLLAFLSLLSLSAPFLANATLVGTTNNATLSLNPNSGIYKVGGVFSVDILLNTHGQNVVGVSAFFYYDPNLFQVVSIDTGASIFTTEWEKVNDPSGIIKISRTIPTPGVNTVNGKVATLNIQGLKDIPTPTADNFTFKFTAGLNADSQVILDDQLGTNILSGADSGRFTLDGTPPANISNFTATPNDGSILLSWTNPTVDFSGVTILRKTGSYPTSANDGTIIYDSTGTSYNNTGLTNGITYYYKAFSRDIVLNYSSGAQVSATPIDSTPPSAITNLSATALNAGSVRLNWTAVGDNGSVGTAANYNIRYSTSIVTSANFNSATQVSGAPIPKASGNAETMNVSGLTGNTTYYFAIKAVDAAGNSGNISNIPNAKTYKTADLNNDGLVNIADAGIMMSFWGSTVRPAADINQDSIVNINDAGIMMSQWG